MKIEDKEYLRLAKKIWCGDECTIQNVTNSYNRYLIEYKNKGGACRQTYVDAIDKDAAHKAFFVYNDGTIISITDIRFL